MTNPPRIIDLKKISDPKGNLTPIESGVDIPFEIRRAYYTYDIPGGETRGGHAHIRAGSNSSSRPAEASK